MAVFKLFPETTSVDVANSATALINIAIRGGSFPAANGDFGAGSHSGFDNSNDTLLLMSETETTPGSGIKSGTPMNWVTGDTVSDNAIHVARDGVRIDSDFERSVDDIPAPGVEIKQILHMDRVITVAGEMSGLTHLTRITPNQPRGAADSPGGPGRRLLSTSIILR